MNSTPAAQVPSPTPTPRVKTPAWQITAINRLTVRFFLAGTLGVVVSAALTFALQRSVGLKLDFGLLLFVGWSTAGYLFIQAAYQRGVRDGREHPSDEDAPTA